MKSKTFLLGLALTCFSSFAFGAETPKDLKKKEIKKTETIKYTKVVEQGSCFNYSFISDCGSSHGSWCGSMEGFRKMIDAFLAEDCSAEE
ncbi:hypothetical protein D1Z98_04585 [Riemerella anatipestifer]|uniref:hypothetical protein n=1 Tax=Riemerella anatipestifer TaxID=34085 RepID=UPI000D685A02|nr:hypothetical protein [Riemerella anatipestifer]MRM85207.1 hypothetical protein [Riemerella anatipestifer]MRM94272.1 hypothetical protein [Riemerella anatipestifer]WPC11780.1 hypothetical protein LEQ05_05835 [Riemerella anatipestifer]WPC12526.1 hypothetical protein LEQ03_09810 [Riemerella anatipestifer]WPC15628.1 hypothetical protein LEQ04_01300 [Riemerella anatipestifer]